MAFDLSISKKTTLGEIERMLQCIASGEAIQPFQARLPNLNKSKFFKDIWGAAAVATGLEARQGSGTVVAWGMQNWDDQSSEDSFALSFPALIALQRGATVLTEAKPSVALDAQEIRRTVTLANGIFGDGGKHFQTIVELDPDYSVAAKFSSGPERRTLFLEFMRGRLSDLAIASLARPMEGSVNIDYSSKDTILEYLYEIHNNAAEHGRADTNVRLMRLMKHHYLRRDLALPSAQSFTELEAYIGRQPQRLSNANFNLVEASVSDFGPGILDGFLGSFAGARHKHRERRDVLNDVLHKQLSSKSSDPTAGLGISDALRAARKIGAFVSLRTGEFWLTMDGQLSGEPRLTFRDGDFAKIVGTHWQLLLRDPTNSDAGIARA